MADLRLALTAALLTLAEHLCAPPSAPKTARRAAPDLPPAYTRTGRPAHAAAPVVRVMRMWA